MDFEAPMDGWYVFVGAMLVTFAITGLAMSLPTTPPPDATQAANTVDRVAGSSMGAEGTYDHDAEHVRVGVRQLSMRNDGGTAHASVSYGDMAPVFNDSDLQAVLYGGHPSQEYDVSALPASSWEEAFHQDVQAAEDRAEDPEWRAASGELRVTAVEYKYNGTRHTGVLVDA